MVNDDFLSLLVNELSLFFRFPHDNGMFQVSYANSISLVDTNTMKQCESFNFTGEIFWSDWSKLDPNLVAGKLLTVLTDAFM